MPDNGRSTLGLWGNRQQVQVLMVWKINSSRALMDVMKPTISDLLCWLLCSSQGTESLHICSFFLVGYMIHHSHLKLATCPEMLAFGFKGGYDFCILLSLVWLREFIIYDLSRIKGEEYFFIFYFFVRSPGQLEYKLGRELCILTLHSWVLSWMDKVKSRPCMSGKIQLYFNQMSPLGQLTLTMSKTFPWTLIIFIKVGFTIRKKKLKAPNKYLSISFPHSSPLSSEPTFYSCQLPFVTWRKEKVTDWHQGEFLYIRFSVSKRHWDLRLSN